MSDINKLYRQFTEAKREETFAKKQLKEIRDQLFDATVDEGEEYEVDDKVIRIVRPSSDAYDWDKILYNIGELKFKKISKLVGDEDLLTEALANGTIKAKDLKGCITEVPKTAYVQVYKKKEEEDEDF